MSLRTSPTRKEADGNKEHHGKNQREREEGIVGLQSGGKKLNERSQSEIGAITSARRGRSRLAMASQLRGGTAFKGVKRVQHEGGNVGGEVLQKRGRITPVLGK